MTIKRWLPTAALLILLLALQAQLWLGRGSVPEVRGLRERLAAQQVGNAQLEREQQRLTAELRDLKDGLEAVEEKARTELGMVKPGEIYVHYAKPQ